MSDRVRTSAVWGCTEQVLAIAPGYAQLSEAEAAWRFVGQRSARSRRGDRVALVDLAGPLRKGVMVAKREEIYELAEDPGVKEVVIIVDSPGGSVDGAHDLAAAVSYAASQKRVTAFIEDLGASGAYWAIAGATEIVCNATALVGSIGVYHVVIDASRMLEQRGVDYLVIRSGKHKGAGVWGAKIGAEELAHLQERVDAVADLFVADVARGRRMNVARVRDIADGRVFTGRQAQAAGLVDGVSTLNDALRLAVTRNTAPLYSELKGQAADAKFEELCREIHQPANRWERFELGDGVGKLVADRHPDLAQAVAKWRKSVGMT